MDNLLYCRGGIHPLPLRGPAMEDSDSESGGTLHGAAMSIPGYQAHDVDRVAAVAQTAAERALAASASSCSAAPAPRALGALSLDDEPCTAMEVGVLAPAAAAAGPTAEVAAAAAAAGFRFPLTPVEPVRPLLPSDCLCLSDAGLPGMGLRVPQARAANYCADLLLLSKHNAQPAHSRTSDTNGCAVRRPSSCGPSHAQTPPLLPPPNTQPSPIHTHSCS